MGKTRKAADDRELTPQERAELMELANATRGALDWGVEKMGALLGVDFTTISRRGTGAITLTPQSERLYRLLLAAANEGLEPKLYLVLDALPEPRDENTASMAVSAFLEREGKGWIVAQVLGITPIGYQPPPMEDDVETVARANKSGLGTFEGARQGAMRRMKTFCPENQKKLTGAMSQYDGFLEVYEEVIEDEARRATAPTAGDQAEEPKS